MTDDTARGLVLISFVCVLSLVLALTLGRGAIPERATSPGWHLSSQEAPPWDMPLVGLWETEPGYFDAITFRRIGPEWLSDRPEVAQAVATRAPTAWCELP